jgi:hypothetical protein
LFQEATDSVDAFQMGMREAQEGLDSVEVRVDIHLHHPGTFEHFIEGLEEHPSESSKIPACSDSVTWCGRTIKKKGISFDDTYIQGLVEMASPRTAEELQRFCCGVNWLSFSLPHIAEHMDPFQE